MAETGATNENNNPVFEIQRIYLLDASFESPRAPEIFTEELKAATNVDLNSNNRKLADNVYDVVLNITVTVKVAEEVAYLIEIKQGGIFTISGYQPQDVAQIVGSQCPAIIYPFSREIICDLAVKGGFPQIHMAPINFDALYTHHLREQSKAQSEKDDAVKH